MAKTRSPHCAPPHTPKIEGLEFLSNATSMPTPGWLSFRIQVNEEESWTDQEESGSLLVESRFR
jgi:hypothetical protein